MACLIIETGELNKEPCTITLGNESIIGREKSNNVYIDDPRASRQHAKIIKEPDGSFTLVDMGSRNGMIVNGEKVSRRKLIDKDRIVIGRTTLVYNESEPSSVQPAAPARPAAPVETVKMTSAAPMGEPPQGHSVPRSDFTSERDDKTITATQDAPSKLKSDALQKAIQDAASTRAPEQSNVTSRRTGGKQITSIGSASPAGAAASKPAVTGEQVIEEEPSLGKRILVFLTFLIFFVVILLFAREATKRLLYKADKAHQAKNISSSTQPK